MAGAGDGDAGSVEGAGPGSDAGGRPGSDAGETGSAAGVLGEVGEVGEAAGVLGEVGEVGEVGGVLGEAAGVLGEAEGAASARPGCVPRVAASVSDRPPRRRQWPRGPDGPRGPAGPGCGCGGPDIGDRVPQSRARAGPVDKAAGAV